MIGPVSSTGRSMMASLQQAIQKGMPVDQAIAYVKGMSTQGVAPLTDLYTMMNQFQRLKQQQVQPPQTPPTIKDQIGQMDMQQRMQQQLRDQMRQGGNIQQMQAGAPAPQPMDRGLGAIDAGRMQYPQFAGGGIVAFADGGDVVHMAEGTPRSAFQAVGAPLTSFEDVTEGDLLTSDEEKELAGLLQLQRNVSMSPYVDPASATLWERSKPRYQELIMKRKGAQEKDISTRSEAAARAEAERRGLKYVPPASAVPAAPPVEKPAPPKPAGAATYGLGGDYGDFSKIRSGYSDIEKQLKPAAEKTVEQNLADIEALQKKQGIGEASRKRGEYLTQRELEAGKSLDQDKRMALAQAGFAMAEAASRRGRDRTGFLGAAAIGGTTGTKLYQAALKENQAIKDRIADNRFALDQAEEMRKAGNIKDANALEKEAKANLRALGMARIQSEQGIAELQTRESGADRRTAAQLASQDKRYAEAASIQRSKVMQTLLQNAPMLITGYNKMSQQEQGKALQDLLGSLSGGKGLSGTIEAIEED